jgi:hypothetical protein
MPVSMTHLLEGHYSDAPLDKVSNAILEALVGTLQPPLNCNNAPDNSAKNRRPLRAQLAATWGGL